MALRTLSRPTAEQDTEDRVGAGPAPPNHPAGGRRGSVLDWLAPLALGGLVLLIWQGVTQLRLVSTFLLPAPGDVFQTLGQTLRDGVMTTALAATLQESLAGFALGLCVALPLGYGIARNRLLARAVEPYLAMSQALPAVALAPLLVLWLGYGLLPITLLCTLIVFFPIAIGTILGLRTLDRDIVDAARVDGASPWQLFWSIEGPLALPSILAGVRNGLTLSITGAVVGEFVIDIDSRGLGGLLLVARGNFDPKLVFATLIMLALLAALMYGTGWLIERFISYQEIH